MNSNICYGEWLVKWLYTYKKPYVKSWKAIENHIRDYVPRDIQQTLLRDLCVIDIQNSINSIPLSRTRIDIFDIYHGSLFMAYKLGYLNTNIAELLVKPEHKRKQGKPLTSVEIAMLFYNLKSHRLLNFYKFCLLTGCRRSEALCLLWSDIDFETDTLHIRGTKTATSDRYFPLSPILKELLQSIKPKKGSKTVFRHRADYVTKTFRKVCPNHKLHDLRHTFATRCLECGINVSVISQWLGHSRLETTYKIYAHVLPDYQRQEIKKFTLI